MINIKQMQTAMAEYGLSFNKALGQNFLTNRETLEFIAETSGITQDSGVIEIGAGLGTLTRVLAAFCARVVSVEVDNGLYRYLSDNVASDSITIINADATKLNFGDVARQYLPDMPIYVAANLPYCITSEIIFKLLEELPQCQRMTYMVQKEVADRLKAKPSTKAYGSLSVGVQYRCDVELVRLVGAGQFYPPPKVGSAIITLTRHNRYTCANEQLLLKIIRAAFGQRRKTLANAIANSGILDIPKEKLQDTLQSLFGNESIRGEALHISDFIKLTDALC